MKTAIYIVIAAIGLLLHVVGWAAIVWWLFFSPHDLKAIAGVPVLLWLAWLFACDLITKRKAIKPTDNQGAAK